MDYRWPTVFDWLRDKSEQMDRDELRSALMQVAVKCDPDEIQDIFESEMDNDGYFDEKE